MKKTIQTVGNSDIGLVRANNEDYWKELPDLHFYAIADGMGGHNSGEIASRDAVESLCQKAKLYARKLTRAWTTEEVKKFLTSSFIEINQEIFNKGKSEKQFHGMGTTLCALVFINDEDIVYAHVGDSRIYYFHEEKLQQLSQDHSLLNDLTKTGLLNREQAKDFTYKHILTMAIGPREVITPSVGSKPSHSREIYMMCTDGLSDYVPLAEMEEVIKQEPSLEKISKELIERAKNLVEQIISL